MMQEQNSLSPRFGSHTRGDTTVVYGFDLDLVQENACFLVARGFVPVDEEYCLMEHKVTGQQGHFRRISFIFNPSSL